jgi:hypothetical protein
VQPLALATVFSVSALMRFFTRDSSSDWLKVRFSESGQPSLEVVPQAGREAIDPVATVSITPLKDPPPGTVMRPSPSR